jgi:uncharacterized protein YeaO (DUF488 family)
MIRGRRWNDPAESGDGTRILICRYRPRGLRKDAETWDEWVKELAPSRELLDEYHAGLSWDEYSRRYLDEMGETRPRFFLTALRQRVAGGEAITLLCSSACTDETRCHRTLLRALLQSSE